jgi:hypothetical protein
MGSEGFFVTDHKFKPGDIVVWKGPDKLNLLFVINAHVRTEDDRFTYMKHNGEIKVGYQANYTLIT